MTIWTGPNVIIANMHAGSKACFAWSGSLRLSQEQNKGLAYEEEKELFGKPLIWIPRKHLTRYLQHIYARHFRSLDRMLVSSCRGVKASQECVWRFARTLDLFAISV